MREVGMGLETLKRLHTHTHTHTQRSTHLNPLPLLVQGGKVILSIAPALQRTPTPSLPQTTWSQHLHRLHCSTTHSFSNTGQTYCDMLCAPQIGELSLKMTLHSRSAVLQNVSQMLGPSREVSEGGEERRAQMRITGEGCVGAHTASHGQAGRRETR